MAHGDFVWCDLSTFDEARAQQFYSTIFGWRYTRDTQPTGAAYAIANTGNRETAGIFTMPQKFQDMGLPSFWMSYIQVEDIKACAAAAERLGGKVEVRPTPFSDDATIALIRDPLGAGFTVLQGGLPARPERPAPGQMAWNGLYVSNAGAVGDFYTALFDWRVSPTSIEKHWEITSRANKRVATLDEVSDALRGGFEFWGVHFAVADIAQTSQAIKRAGGEVIYTDEDGKTVLARDLDGAVFFVRAASATKSAPEVWQSKRSVWPWKTVIALVAVWVAVALEQNWVWGVIFLLWTWPAMRFGQAYFVEQVDRRKHPIIFWLLVGTWITLSVFLIAFDLLAL